MESKELCEFWFEEYFLNFLLLSDDKIFTGYKPNGIQPKTRRRFEVNRLKGV